MKLITYTDGGSRGNPGPSAIGAVIVDEHGNTVKEYGEKIEKGTNNEAEYKALIFALKKIKALYGKEKTVQIELEMRMDSELAFKQLSGEYKIESENIKPLFIDIWNLKLDFKKVEFKHVYREQNKRADFLLNEALDKENGSLF